MPSPNLFFLTQLFENVGTGQVGTHPNNIKEGVDLFLFFLINQGGALILKNSWKLMSDQDGGSGGHHSGQRRVQVREKATGDLLIFVFIKSSPLSFQAFTLESESERESFLTTFCVNLYNHVQFLKRVRAD